MSKVKEPAFPCEYEGSEMILGHYVKVKNFQEGMSKRFYAACAAMQGLISANPVYMQGNIDSPVPELLVKEAYLFADELLKQEDNE